MTEKDFENKIVKTFLKSLNKCWFFKVHGGSMFQVAGIPDIIGVVNGKFIALELKAEKGTPSQLQLRIIRLIKAAGGYAKVVYPKDWEEVEEELRRLDDGL